MARSIWNAEERELLVQYVAQYKAGDEDSRILLLENKVIPQFLAKFPPRQAESDGDETEHAEGDLREIQRRMKQKIHSWFIKKAPTNVSLTPRRKPRARGDPREREVLKHYIELYRVGTERSRKILLTTRVLPEYIRQFHPFGNVNTLSQEQKSRYKKHVRDWLTIEAYYRDEGEQDPEHGLHLSLDTYPDSDDGDGESAYDSPSPSAGRKRRISPSGDELPITKKRKPSTNTITRGPASSAPSREAVSASSATPRRPAARLPTLSQESAAPLSPPQTPLPKFHAAHSRRYSARNIVYSTPVKGSSQPEEGSEPDLEPEPEPELEEDELGDEGIQEGSELEPEPELEPEYGPEAGSVYEFTPEPQPDTASRRKSRFRARSRSATPSPQHQQDDQDAEQDVEDQDQEDQEEEMLMLQEKVIPEEETLKEDVEMPQNSDDEDVMMQDEEDQLQEDDLQEQEEELQEVVVVQQQEDQVDELEHQEEEEEQPKRSPRQRPVASPPPIDLNASGNGVRSLGDVALPVGGIDPLVWSRHIKAALYVQLKEFLTPLFHQTILEVVNGGVQGPPQIDINNTATHNEQDGHDGHDKNNGRNDDQVNVVIQKLIQNAQQIQDLKQQIQQKSNLESQLVHAQENPLNVPNSRKAATLQQILTTLKRLEIQSDSTVSQINSLSKRVKDLYDVMNDNKGRKRKPKRARDPTATATGVVASPSSLPRAQPAAIEAFVGRFRKAIGAQVTVTYYLAKLPKRPLEEAVWRSLDDCAELPNSAIILEVFHAQAEAEGLNLSNTKDDYVYLRDAILAGWDSDGTVHRRA